MSMMQLLLGSTYLTPLAPVGGAGGAAGGLGTAGSPGTLGAGGGGGSNAGDRFTGSGGRGGTSGGTGVIAVYPGQDGARQSSGSNRLPGLSSDVDYASGVGVGVLFGTGGPGRVVIINEGTLEKTVFATPGSFVFSVAPGTYTIKLWGAGGGGASGGSNGGAYGGAAACIIKTGVVVANTETWNIFVASGGTSNSDTINPPSGGINLPAGLGGAGYGNGGNGAGNTNWNGGGGGGSSAVSGPSVGLMCASGGGGAGGDGSVSQQAGGGL